MRHQLRLGPASLLLLVVGALLAASWLTSAQQPQVGICVGATACPNPQAGDLWSDTAAGALKRYNGSTWDAVGGGGESVPVGAILAIISGSCPAGYAEETGLNGRTPLGTLAANSNIGTTGGADTITPAGTVAAPTFSGTAFTAVINHTHTVTVTDPGHTHTQASQTATTGSISSWEHGAIDTSSTAAETLNTGSNTTGITASTANPAGGVASITPAGTVSAPAFTGTQFDNRAAFVRVIFCRKT